MVEMLARILEKQYKYTIYRAGFGISDLMSQALISSQLFFGQALIAAKIFQIITDRFAAFLLSFSQIVLNYRSIVFLVRLLIILV